MVQFPNGMCLAHQELRTSLTISWSFMVLVRWGDTRPALVRFLNVPVHDRIQQQRIRMNGSLTLMCVCIGASVPGCSSSLEMEEVRSCVVVSWWPY